MKTSILALLSFGLLLLIGCGGGSVTATSPNGSVRAVFKPGAALSAGQSIGVVNLTISVPTGVTAILNPDGSVNTAATLQIGGSSPANYTITDVKPASNSIEFTGIKADGFGANDTMTINLKVNPGVFPTKEQFSITSTQVYDLTGAPLSITPTLETTIQ